jgi:hypothetical protein
MQVILGGRDQEYHGLRPAQAKSLQDPFSTMGHGETYLSPQLHGKHK